MSLTPSASAAEASRLLGSGRRHWIRKFKDRAAAVAISAGGMSVLVAILLIFFYLLYEIVPLFRSAAAQPVASYALVAGPEGAAPPLYLALEEQAEIGLRLDRLGRVAFFRAASGEPVENFVLPIPPATQITSFALDSEQSQLLALGLSDGSVVLTHHEYSATYDGKGRRQIAPSMTYPFGDKPLVLQAGEALQAIALRNGDNGLVVVAASGGGHLVARKWEKREDFLSGESVTEEVALAVPEVDINPTRLLISPDQKWLYVLAGDGNYRVVDLKAGNVIDSGRLFASGELTDAKFLLGGISIMVASNHGELSQWFLVRKPDASPQLTRIRSFGDGSAVNQLAMEHRRKGFVTVDAKQQLQIYYSTSQRHLLSAPAGAPVSALAMSPRANALIYETGDNKLHFWSVTNNHPEISWSVLWDKVWYENYPLADYVWQSSSANSDFEPKYSLMPLAFGTLKAAFYAMLVATPLAICGALYTAYFMAPTLRRKVKPLVELMAALPTVILGFLAGLWLAPVVEHNLPGIFFILIFMPIAVLLFAFLWNQLPIAWRKWVPDGWQPLILVPVVIITAYLCIAFSAPFELAWFGGDMRSWMRSEWGVDYAQRNALVVGIAMGFAVIPNIFSIAEDAIFSVPKHLSYGSLALGATPWQTLVGVVLPTASPGIFSALMIGLGRAVGETMIVLMAAGNTAVMDGNLFQGMRTLSANIAVEIGETAVDSTHYRVLFLAAFVLFMFTFVLNTLAEIIRNRLRNRYSVI
ncbi:MAG TPA: ABC transporter permease subunit [Spongiibacteraceae bacterium]|nr:ABC transporter permease subunit [Spongiibacteraceae bacterium]